MATALGFQGFLHTGERRRERAVWVSRGGNTTSMSFTVTQFHIRNAPLPPSFSPLRFRSSMRERKSFLRRFDAT